MLEKLMLEKLEQIIEEIKRFSQKQSFAANNLAECIKDVLDVECKVLGGTNGDASSFQEKYGVYVFFLGEKCLKVGKVGPNSEARWKYQHYRFGAAKSSLPNSIKNDTQFFTEKFSGIDKGQLDALKKILETERREKPSQEEPQKTQTSEQEDIKKDIEEIQNCMEDIKNIESDKDKENETEKQGNCEPSNIGAWIKKYCVRLEFILSNENHTAESKKKLAFATNFLEAFFQWQLEPRYEGRQISL